MIQTREMLVDQRIIMTNWLLDVHKKYREVINIRCMHNIEMYYEIITVARERQS